MKKSIMKAVLLMMVAGYGTGLAACNTVEGAGQDIQRGGEKIEGAAQNAK